jgi:hypothetical protein
VGRRKRDGVPQFASRYLKCAASLQGDIGPIADQVPGQHSASLEQTMRVYYVAISTFAKVIPDVDNARLFRIRRRIGMS